MARRLIVAMDDRPWEFAMQTQIEAQAPDRPTPEITRSRRIGILVYPGCDSVDVCGPADAFYFADAFLPRFGRSGESGYETIILATTPGPVPTLCGIQLVANRSYHGFEEGLDTLIVVGGVVTVEQACADPALLVWVRAMAPKVRRLASICTGAYILAAAGLLNHRRVTTHWMFADALAATYPLVAIDSSLLFARDGNIYSSGGITAGIDLALALVEEDHGCEIALATARMLVVFPRRPGGQSQFSGHMNWGEIKPRPDIAQLEAWMLGNPGADLTVPSLADRMGMSPRNFSRLFHSETGKTPAQFAERVRADAARLQLEQTNTPVELIAEQCGFGNAERMRRTFQRLFNFSPQDYRERFRSTLLA
jgi:transcriptional regulator GlxA family with amidase domain